MAEVRVTQELSSPAEVVWALIGDFGALHRWHPAVRGLDLSWEGRIRTLHFADGTRAVERLETRNDAAHRYAYAWVDGPLPVRGYHATLQVSARRRGCTVTWSCVFEPADADEHDVHDALHRHYAEGLTALALALVS